MRLWSQSGFRVACVLMDMWQIRTPFPFYETRNPLFLSVYLLNIPPNTSSDPLALPLAFDILSYSALHVILHPSSFPNIDIVWKKDMRDEC